MEATGKQTRSSVVLGVDAEVVRDPGFDGSNYRELLVFLPLSLPIDV